MTLPLADTGRFAAPITTATSTSVKEPQRYPQLQILRGFAAVAVVADHVWHSPQGGGGVRDTLHVGDLADLAVMVFFCLSGMLMVLTTKSEIPGLKPAAFFLRSRVERIYPVYVLWLSILLGIVMLAAAAGSGFLSYKLDVATPSVVLRNYLLLPGLPDEDYGMFIGQAWTLVYEMYFYVVFAGCLLFSNGNRLLAILCVVIGCPVLVAWAADYQVDRLGWVNIAYLTTDPLVLNFLMGGLFGAWLGQRRRNDMDLPLAGKPGLQWTSVVVAFAVCMMPLPSRLSFVHNVGSVALLISVTFLVVGDARIVRGLRSLGDASYSIYVSHVIFAIIAYHAEIRLPLQRDVVGLMLVALSIGVGLLSYSLVERRMDKYLRHRRVRYSVG